MALRSSGVIERVADDYIGDLWESMAVYFTFLILKKKTKILNVIGR